MKHNEALRSLEALAVEAISDFRRLHALNEKDKRLATDLQVARAAGRSCALQDAYAALGNISEDAAADYLHEKAGKYPA